MTYKFTIVSDEVEDFVRIIEIDSEATFLDLNNAIIKSVGYDDREMTSFFTCSDDWEKEQEVTLIEMDSSSEYDNLVMESTRLEELLDDEKQKLLFVFDIISERAFFMELTEIITGKDLNKPICNASEGKAPIQIENDFSLTSIQQSKTLITEQVSDSNKEFYGDKEYEDDEFAKGGFADLNFDGNDLV